MAARIEHHFAEMGTRDYLAEIEEENREDAAREREEQWDAECAYENGDDEDYVDAMDYGCEAGLFTGAQQTLRHYPFAR